MRTLIVGAATAMIAGVMTGTTFWSDLPTQTLAKSPQLQTTSVVLVADESATEQEARADRESPARAELRPAVSSDETGYGALRVQSYDAEAHAVSATPSIVDSAALIPQSSRWIAASESVSHLRVE